MTGPSVDPNLVAQISDAVDQLADELEAFLAELIRLPTVNPPGEAYQACAELIDRRYRQLGYTTVLLPAQGLSEHTDRHPRINVVGRLERPGPTLHFNGHFDVVPAGEGWTVPPFEARRIDGRLYGRGAADQKSGLAASLFAIEAIRRSGLELLGSVEQSATVDEESGGFAGVAYLCQQGWIRMDRTDFVIITEPLGQDRVCLGHRGVYWFEVIAHGRTAHGSMPDLGQNAIDLMAEFVSRLNRDLKPRLAGRLTSMPVEPPLARRPSLNLNSLHGGQLVDGLETPCVPDLCRAVFDRRFIVEESFESVRAEIQACVDSANRNGPGLFELRDVMVVLPVETPRSARVASALARAIERILGRPASFIASPGTYDQKHVQRIGQVQECVAYGPGILELAHQPDEYVDLEHLVASAKVMALAALDLLGWRPAPS